MRLNLGIKPVERDRMGARCGELAAPDLSWAASHVAAEGGAAASAAEAVTSLHSEPRASEHEAGSYTGGLEGCTYRRVLRFSPTSRVARLSRRCVVLVYALARVFCRLHSSTVSPRYAPEKGRHESHT
jgi:hypothetical protein